MAQLRTCLRLQVKSCYHKPRCISIHKPPAQARTAKAPLKARRTEERFGSHSSSARLRFEREDSLLRAGTCSGRAGLRASLLRSQTASVRGSPALPFPHQGRCFPSSQQTVTGKEPEAAQGTSPGFSKMLTPLWLSPSLHSPRAAHGALSSLQSSDPLSSLSLPSKKSHSITEIQQSVMTH